MLHLHLWSLNITTYFATQHEESLLFEDDVLDFDREDDHDNSETPSLLEHMNISHSSINYFTIADAIARGCIPSAPKPHRTFATPTTAFHIANKPSLRMTVDEATTLFGIPDFHPAIWEFLQHIQDPTTNFHDIPGTRLQDIGCPLPFDHIQIWYQLHVQQHLYHEDK